MKRIHLAIPAVCLFLLSACGSRTGDAPKAEAPAAAPAPVFAVLEFARDHLPAGLAFSGSIADGAHWRDAHGDNWLLLTTETRETTSEDMDARSTFLKGFLFTGSDGAYRLVREIKDGTYDCVLDMSAAFTEGSVMVTDLNANSIGEVSFLYTLGCAGDISPSDLKFLMLEGEMKYAIRGLTTVYENGRKIAGGRKTIDPVLAKGPKEFLDFANARWAKFCETRYEY